MFHDHVDGFGFFGQYCVVLHKDLVIENDFIQHRHVVQAGSLQLHVNLDRD